MCANLFSYISGVNKTELIRNIVGNMGPVRKETSESNAVGLDISSCTFQTGHRPIEKGFPGPSMHCQHVINYR